MVVLYIILKHFLRFIVVFNYIFAIYCLSFKSFFIRNTHYFALRVEIWMAETTRNLSKAWRDDTISKRTTRRWIEKFRNVDSSF